MAVADVPDETPPGPVALRCPRCRGSFDAADDVLRCIDCDRTVERTADGQWDFRLTTPKTVAPTIEVGTPVSFDDVPWSAPPAPTDRFESTVRHQNARLLGQVPDAADGGALLDLGCGDETLERFAADRGYEWVGLDVTGPDATYLGDVHALPFATDSFDAVVSLKVFEHIESPTVAAQEIARVLKPDATFLGSVAFLETFHGESQYHHSPNGVVTTLRHGGFAVDHVWPGWNLTDALADFGLFPYLPAVLAGAVLEPIRLASTAWYTIGGALVDHPKASETYRLARTSGEFFFVARAP